MSAQSPEDRELEALARDLLSVVDQFLRVPGAPGLWAACDSAAVPSEETGEVHPPTAQHACTCRR